jgi:hypothetical protein
MQKKKQPQPRTKTDPHDRPRVVEKEKLGDKVPVEVHGANLFQKPVVEHQHPPFIPEKSSTNNKQQTTTQTQKHTQKKPQFSIHFNDFTSYKKYKKIKKSKKIKKKRVSVSSVPIFFFFFCNKKKKKKKKKCI